MPCTVSVVCSATEGTNVGLLYVYLWTLSGNDAASFRR